MNPRVCIVIPTHNGVRFLDETIRSVCAQDFSEWEIVVVDDGSTDDTPAVLAGWAARDRRIRHFRRSVAAGNACPARNEGIARSNPSAEFFVFLDHDDLLTPDALTVLMRALRDAPEAAGAHGLVEFIDGEGRRLGASEPGSRREMRSGRLVFLKPDEPTTFEAMATVCCVSSPGSAMVRRAALPNEPLFPETDRRALDWDGWLALTRQAPMVMLPRVVLSYRQTPHGMTANRRALHRRMAATRVRTSQDMRFSPEQRIFILKAAPLMERFDGTQKIRQAVRALASGRVGEAVRELGYAVNCYRRALVWRKAETAGPGA